MLVAGGHVTFLLGDFSPKVGLFFFQGPSEI